MYNIPSSEKERVKCRLDSKGMGGAADTVRGDGHLQQEDDKDGNAKRDLRRKFGVSDFLQQERRRKTHPEKRSQDAVESGRRRPAASVGRHCRADEARAEIRIGEMVQPSDANAAEMPKTASAL